MLLYVSLKVGERVLGIIALRAAFFSAADQKFLTILAAQSAAALENAMRHEAHITAALKAQREQLMFDLAMKNPFFKKLMSVAEKHCSDIQFSVAKLAKLMRLSTSQLQRKISALSDLTPHQIIRDLRLARAKALLLETDLSVSEVAFRAGFNDPSYFTRLFTQETGRTPSIWKAQQEAGR
jgi:AraC-like DNA-binding protein